MATTAAELVVEVSGRATNIDAILTAVEAKAKQADAAGQQLSGTFSGPVSAAQQRAANSALQTAAAYSRLALSEGEPARAASILRTALDQNVGASERVRVSLQATATRLESGATAFRQFGDAAKSSLLGVIGPAAAAGAALSAAIKIVGSFDEAFKLKANLDATTASIAIQLRGVRDSGVAFDQAAAFADKYKLTQEEVNQALLASVGILRQSRSGADELLGVLSRLQVLSPEQGLEGAALALKELQSGSTTSLVGRFEVSRAAANKMKEEIEGGADAVQVMAKYLDNAGVGMDALATRTTGAMGALNDLKVANQDLALAQAQFAQGPGLAILNERITLTSGLTRLLSADTAQMGQSLVQAGQQGTTSFQGMITALGPLGAIISQATGYADAHANALRADVAEAQAQAAAAAQASQGINLQSSAMIEAAAAAEAARQAAADHANAVQESAQASVADSFAKNEQAAVTELLQLQTTNAVNAFLELNPNLHASAAAAAAAAAGYAPEIAKLIEIAARARDARGEIAALNALSGVRSQVAQDFRAGERSGGAVRTEAEQARVADARRAQLVIAQQAADAENRYNQQIGNLGPVRARIEGELALARARGDKAAEFDALTRLDQLDDKAAKAHKARGGAKLSDQTKLDNQLLSQAEKSDNQLEDAALKHEKRIQDIEQAAFEKRIAAEKAFNQDWLDANASFYEQLGSIGSSGNAKIDQQLRKELSARREAAVLEAQKMGGDQGDAFLKASEAAIAKEGQIQDKINKAKQDKNSSEAEYQAGVLALQKQADDARLASIREGGSAIENERQKQLDDESASYAEQTGKILTASDRATQAKILNAQRSGKQIDVENLKLQDQASLYDQINAKATTRGGAGAAASAASGTPPAAGAAGITVAGPVGPLDLTALLSKLDEVKDALVAAERQAARDVAGAVRGAQASGGIAG